MYMLKSSISRDYTFMFQIQTVLLKRKFEYSGKENKFLFQFKPKFKLRFEDFKIGRFNMLWTV